MHKLTEGRKMFWSVTAIFLVYAIIFILFEDYDRRHLAPFDEASDWHLLLFSLIVMAGLSLLLLRYAHRMDDRINREKDEKQALLRREMTQNISHELKTPVASILGYTETLLCNPDISAEQRNLFIQRTNAQAQRLSALLEDLSVLNRMDYASDSLQRERVDVSLLVSEIIDDYTLRLQARQMTIRNCLPESIIVHGNPSLLSSIFTNLIENALLYAGQGSTIEIEATTVTHDLKTCWQFTFSDNGVGIDPEHLDRIFERFYRIDKGRSRSFGGTGLGLAIVKNAVQLHGGTIHAESRPEGGLRFVFTFSC